MTCHCEDIAQLQGEVAKLSAVLPVAHALLQPDETLSLCLKDIVDSIPYSATIRTRTIIQNAAELHTKSAMLNTGVEAQIVNAINSINQTIASLEAKDKKYHAQWAQMVSNN